MGTVSVSIVRTHPGIEGNARVVYADVTFSDSYATGGDSFTTDQFQLGEITSLGIQDGATNGGYVPNTDYANSKFKAFEAGADGAALDEVGNTTDLSAESFRVRAVGIG